MKGGAGRRRTPFDAHAALRGETEHALALLAQPPLTDESIHAFRQTLKRARALLRLLRDAVSDSAYVRENTCLRDAARPLARARDAAVMLDLIDELLAARKMRRYRPTLLRLRAQFRKSHERLLAGARAKRTMGRMRRLLGQSLQRTAHWRMPRDTRPVYASGLRRIYRKGRNELEAALAQGGAGALHEWRKQVKYLGVALALVAPALPRSSSKAAVAEEIARRLGDDHDLAVLATRLRRMAAGRALTSKLEGRRGKLQKRAVELARRLYKRTPDRFAVRLQIIKP